MIIDNDLSKQILGEYRLTTAEILYHMPDCRELLQSYVWQDYDIAPKFPVLGQFLQFWMEELEGPLHSVTVASKQIITPAQAAYYNAEFNLQ